MRRRCDLVEWLSLRISCTEDGQVEARPTREATQDSLVPAPLERTQGYRIFHRMPTYEVEHVCPLSQEQKDALAMAVTETHSNLFGAPRFFVNVRITDISTHRTYVAGKRVRYTPCRAEIAFLTLSPPFVCTA